MVCIRAREKNRIQSPRLYTEFIIVGAYFIQNLFYRVDDAIRDFLWPNLSSSLVPHVIADLFGACCFTANANEVIELRFFDFRVRGCDLLGDVFGSKHEFFTIFYQLFDGIHG